MKEQSQFNILILPMKEVKISGEHGSDEKNVEITSWSTHLGQWNLELLLHIKEIDLKLKEKGSYIGRGTEFCSIFTR